MRHAYLIAFLLVPVSGALSAPRQPAEGTPAGAAAARYLKSIKPILRSRCVACHGALKQEGGLRLDTALFIRQGGESEAAVVPGGADRSLLIERVTASDESLRMPAEGEPLTAEEIQLLKNWINDGAAAPDDESPQQDPREHWAFQTPLTPEVPLPSDTHWVRNPIDAFLATKHQQHGLTPVSAAAKHELLRRAYLDLVGLPPTRQQLIAFLENDTPHVYEQAVDRLLSSPQYGERWGRHWMDVWRYSDWYGKRPGSLRHSHPHIWHWRDWIIESLNEDKGYDRMVLEMIAGDELAPDDPKIVRATGFLVRNWNIHNRNVWLRETIEHTSKAFLGMTLECARCHDHKFDPISQEEYYEFRAFFEPHDLRIDRVPGEMDVNKDGISRIYDAHLDRKTFLFVRGDDRKPLRSKPLAPRLPRLLGSHPLALEPVALPVTSYYPALRPWVTERLIAEAERERDRAQHNFHQREHSSPAAAELAHCELRLAREKLTSLQSRIAAERAKVRNVSADKVAEFARQASETERRVVVAVSAVEICRAKQNVARLRSRSASGPQEETSAKKLKAAETALSRAEEKRKEALQALADESQEYTALGATYPKFSTGRRLALARWIVDSRNPLTARVAVNHIWLRHFGEPLVQLVYDFGLKGSNPTHPELLEWLAVELMDHDWSMKYIHRLIVTSAAYRMSSSEDLADGTTRHSDPDNSYLWRMNRQRMQAELVRDGVKYLANDLLLEMGGPELSVDVEGKSHRRSVYFLHTRDDRLMMLRLFDAANVEQCYRRKQSIIPHQALALANSSLVLQSARLLAPILSRDAGDNRDFVEMAFQHILGRNPSLAEKKQCVDFLISQSKLLGNTGRLTAFSTGPAHRVKASPDPFERARENLVQVLFNHNDFVTIR